jgi:hypothetical protein
MRVIFYKVLDKLKIKTYVNIHMKIKALMAIKYLPN